MLYATISRQWLGQFFEVNKVAKLPSFLGGLSVPLTLDAPVPTREGFNVFDKSPFYESSFARLYNYYHGYKGSREEKYLLLYAEMIAIQSDNFNAIRSKFVRERDFIVTLAPVPYSVPPQLKQHATAAIDFFKKSGRLAKDENGAWENNVAISISALNPDGHIECRRARYFDQVATNITLDWNTGLLPGPTIRSSVEKPRAGKLSTFEESALANTLGTAVMVVDRKGQIIIRIRNEGNVASVVRRGLHCSVSGVLELPEGHPPGQYDFSLFRHGTEKELRDEMGLEPSDYRLVPLAIARELPRGGKPQIFWVALTDLGTDELGERVRSAREAHEFVIDGRPEPFEPEPDDYGRNADKFTYEGLANLLLAKDFIEANRDMFTS